MNRMSDYFIVCVICFLAEPLLCTGQSNPQTSLTARECYNKAINIEKSIPAYKAVGRIAMRDSKYSYNIITYVKNTETGGRWMHREARDSKTARRFSHVFLENDEGQYYYNDTRLVKVGADFIDENIFYVKYFRSLPQEDGQFSYLPKAPDGNVIVVKAITGNEAETLAARISKKSSEILASLRNRKVKYPGVTDKADIVPVRAFYRISVESGLLMEETYFNRAGKIISTPRKYDVIDTSFMPDADFFETPPGKIVIFPKNAEESWELIKKL